jgi:hypothetical protein
VVPSTDVSPSADGDVPLTPRELEVLALLAEGASNKVIARRLGISVHTPGGHDDLAVVVAGAVPVLSTGFENAPSQRRPEKPRVASVHLRPRPVALPHLR